MGWYLFLPKQNPGIGFGVPNVEKLDEALQAGKEAMRAGL